MRTILALLITCFLFTGCSCGCEELEVITPTQTKDSLVQISKPVDNTQYYYASDFGLPTGKVVNFSPNDETIQTFQVAGGDVPDQQIYIHILDQNGVIKVYESNYKTWLTVYEGAILK